MLEREREADREAAGLFFLQMAELDLAAEGLLDLDAGEYLFDVEADDDGNPVAVIARSQDANGQLGARVGQESGVANVQPTEDASIAETVQKFSQEFVRWLAQLVTPSWIVSDGVRLANAEGNLTRFRFDLSPLEPGWEVRGHLSLEAENGALTLEITTNDRSPRGWVVEFVAPDRSRVLCARVLGHLTPGQTDSFPLLPRVLGFDPRLQPFLLLVRPATRDEW